MFWLVLILSSLHYKNIYIYKKIIQFSLREIFFYWEILFPNNCPSKRNRLGLSLFDKAFIAFFRMSIDKSYNKPTSEKNRKITLAGIKHPDLFITIHSPLFWAPPLQLAAIPFLQLVQSVNLKILWLTPIELIPSERPLMDQPK